MTAERTPRDQTAAVIVVFHPDPARLRRTLDSLSAQVAQLIVVDNTPRATGASTASFNWMPAAGTSLTHIPLGKNHGIAHAQNRGVELARTAGFRYVLLSDQDSEFPAQAVATLVEALADLEAQGIRVAAVAAAHANRHALGAHPVFPGLGLFWMGYISASDGVHEVSAAIASGTLINAGSWEAVGPMDERLFIDWVDFEWCWRARSRGWKVYGCFDTTVLHEVGEHAVRVGKRTICIHPPQRTYYIARNGLHLFLRGRMLPTLPRIGMGLRAILNPLSSVIFGTNRTASLYAMIDGIKDGLRDRLGERFPLQSYDTHRL